MSGRGFGSQCRRGQHHDEQAKRAFDDRLPSCGSAHDPGAFNLVGSVAAKDRVALLLLE
jgi:hypothetical protein